MKELKKNLRRKVKDQLKSLDREMKSEQAINFALHLNSFLKTLSPIQFIGVYAPLSDELNWTKVLELEALLAFPKWEVASEMKFYESSFEELTADRSFGVEVLTPKENIREVVPDTLLIPGLAFTKSGKRLGRGAGFYDRYLENYNGLKIGVCYNEQIVEDIPTEPHDSLMDYVVTGGGLYKADAT